MGRRRPLIFGASAITVALICEAALNSQNLDGSKHAYSIAGVFFLFCVTVIFSMSFGPVSWVYMSEIMPMQIRGKGNAFATGIGNWCVSTLWSQVSPIALGELGWKFYFIFAAWSEFFFCSLWFIAGLNFIITLFPHADFSPFSSFQTFVLLSLLSISSSKRPSKNRWRRLTCSLAAEPWGC